MSLEPRQQRFCEEYLIDLNATQAAIRAGYSEDSAASIGSENLTKPEITAEVDRLKEIRSIRTEITADKVLTETYLLASSDIQEAFDETGALKPIREIPARIRKAIASIEVEKLFEYTGTGKDREKEHVGYTQKIKLWDKVKTLELLGKHLELFKDRVEHSGTLTLEQMVAGAITPAPIKEPDADHA